MKETVEFPGHRLNPVARLGNEEGNPTTRVPLKVPIRPWFTGRCALISVPGVSSSVCHSNSSLHQEMCALQPSALCCARARQKSAFLEFRDEATKHTCTKSPGYSGEGQGEYYKGCLVFLISTLFTFSSDRG